MNKLVNDHHKSVTANDGKPKEVFTMALENYKNYLQEIEGKDV